MRAGRTAPAQLPSGVLTFLFTDIEGSTRLAHELDDDWPAVLDSHHRLLRAAIAEHGGIEISTAGDSFFAVFPAAHGAVSAAITMERAIAAHDWRPHPPIRVRIGMHTGEATIHDRNYAGLTVHTASRVESAAAGGQVLLSAATLEAASPLPDGVDVLDLGPHRLKDLPAEVPLYQVVADGLARDFPPVRGVDLARNNVPVPPSSFVGRTDALTKLHRLLDDERLVTLVGPGGAGKTRLSLKLANERLHRHKDGVWFVELDPVTDHAGVASAVAHAIGVREEPGRPILDSVVDHLRLRDSLLVVDNCEHVIEAAAEIIESLARSGPQTRVVATSREPLNIGGERVWPVAPLSIEGHDPADVEAVQLLADRIRLVRPDFEVLNGTSQTLLAIAQHLDGLPLALELAAASAAMLELDEIVEQLDDRFGLLTRGSRTARDRQKTLRGAIDWGYELLSPDQRAFFRRLGVFPGEFGAQTVAGVFGIDGEAAISAIDALAKKSLVAPTPSQRFRLLESIRAYARERMADVAEAESLTEQRARWFTTGALGRDEGRAWERDLDGFDAVHEDLVAALLWANSNDALLALDVLVVMQKYWMRKGRLTEGRALSMQTLGRDDRNPDKREDRCSHPNRHHDAAPRRSRGDEGAVRTRHRYGTRRRR